MPQFAYFNGETSQVREASASTVCVAAERILLRVPPTQRWRTSVDELMALPVGASLDLTDSPQRTIRREF